ncbi:MAG: hypothetical protein KC468_16990 [Myxococcales bacterium]|nr:hypothetical protein [Myxococcales bacterium]
MNHALASLLRSLGRGRLRAPPLLLLLSLLPALALMAAACSKNGGSARYSEAASAKMDDARDGADGRSGQVTTWKRSQLVPHSSRLQVGDEDALPLAAMHAKVTVDGFRARVVLDYYYVNDREYQLEGTFKVRLPDSASPYFFAFGETRAVAQEPQPVAPVAVERARAMGSAPLQIIQDRQGAWTGPKEARMVPRAKAALAYGNTVRRQVDPALMEWSGAGVFSARVFPLAPKREHRIVFAYDVDLIAAGDALELSFDLPANAPALVVDLDVANLPNTRAVISPEVPAAPAGERLHFRIAQPQEQRITLRLEGAPVTVLRGEDREAGGFFATSFVPALPKVAAEGAARRAVLLIDTSLSANPDGFNVWLKLAEALLRENQDAISEFAVLFFNVEASWWRSSWSKNQPEELAALLADADTLTLEGATDLASALAEAARPRWAGDPGPVDLFLLSDGAATWGESDHFTMSRALSREHTLFAYRTGLAGTDAAALELLARESGGAVFSVVGEAEVRAAPTAHRAKPLRLLGVTVEGADDVMIAGRPRAVFPGQRLSLVGRGALTDAQLSSVRLRFAAGEAGAAPAGAGAADEAPVTEVVIKPERVLDSALAPRAYGQVAVAQLEELGAAALKTATSYALHFRVTGQTSSLLMLESEEDYRSYGIVPESDALVVQQRPAGHVVRETVARVEHELGDPRARFLAWIAGLPATPGVDVQIPRAVEVLLEELPRQAFDVPVQPLRPRARDKDHVPKDYLGLLARRELTYDAVATEAARRAQLLGPDDAIKAWSSLVEHSPGDAVLARDVGYTAMQLGRDAQAFHLFRRVAASRPFEPENYRAMARALERAGKVELAIVYYEIGLAGRWDARFGDFQTIMTYDYARLLSRLARGQAEHPSAGFTDSYARSRLDALKGQVALGADLVVMITWNTDNTDVDLHVVEPTGEECYYGHRETRIGGAMTTDVTTGYGPEMYTLRAAKRGKYRVFAHYFASDQNRTSTRTKVHVMIFERFGSATESVRERTITLETGKEQHEIDTIDVGAAAIAR